MNPEITERKDRLEEEVNIPQTHFHALVCIWSVSPPPRLAQLLQSYRPLTLVKHRNAVRGPLITEEEERWLEAAVRGQRGL